MDAFCVGAHAMALVWRLEDTLWELVLSFHRVDPENQTQVLSLSGKCLLLTQPVPYGALLGPPNQTTTRQRLVLYSVARRHSTAYPREPKAAPAVKNTEEYRWHI